MLRTVTRTTTALSAAALLSSIATSAVAAPQVLAVVASLVDVPVNCQGGNCVAELTTICLTEHRASPGPGTPYTIHEPASLTLTGTRADGTTIALALPESATFNAARGHLSAQVNIPARVLREHGLTGLTVRANRDTTLVPTPRANDPRPLNDAEITIAAGPLRAAAAAVVSADATRIAAAQITAMMVNTLPAGGRAGDADRAAIWHNAVASTAGTLPEESVQLARTAHDNCQLKTTAGAETLRDCLSSSHDALMGSLNKTYWDSVKTGS